MERRVKGLIYVKPKHETPKHETGSRIAIRMPLECHYFPLIMCAPKLIVNREYPVGGAGPHP